jgi:hypothetical protein
VSHAGDHQAGTAPGALRTRLAVAALAALASAFVGYGLWAIASLGLTELYADQWRQYLPYLELSFPASAFAADNGHRAVVPSLIRLLENAWLDGNQLLQLASGAAFALAAWLVLAGVALRERGLSLPARWLVLALAAIALFWLGNARMLLHGNESTQVYLIIACQVGAAALLTRAHAGTGAVLSACLLALVATFSFGPGLAVFPAAAIVLVLQRRWRLAAVVLAATAATLLLYLLLPGGDGVRNSLQIRPLANLHAAATWLTSMWVTLLEPLVDVGAGNALPFGLYQPTRPIAQAWLAAFGDPQLQHAPFAVLGWLGLAGLVWHSWRAWALPSTPRLALVGLGCAWFALGVAGIVALGRLDYFAAHPGQIFANRYVPWSCLFWFGLLAAAIGLRARTQTGAPPRADGRVPRWAWLPAGVMLVMAVLTTPGHRIWSELIQQGVRLDLAGIVSGVIDPRRSLGEGIPEEVIAGTPARRAAGLSAFAWPEARRLGVAATAAGPVPGIELVAIELEPVGNRLGGSATQVTARFARSADVPMPARLLLAVDGRLAGVLVRQTVLPGWSWSGFVPATLAPGGFSVLELAHDGRLRCWAGCPVP